MAVQEDELHWLAVGERRKSIEIPAPNSKNVIIHLVNIDLEKP